MAVLYEIVSDWCDRSLRQKHLEKEFGLRSRDELQEEDALNTKVPEIRRVGEILQKGKEKTAEVIEKLRNDE